MSRFDVDRCLVRDLPSLRPDMPVPDALPTLLERSVAALPVVDGDGALAGVFGEDELLAAVFPGYLRELRSAAFVTGGDLHRLVERVREVVVGDVMNRDVRRVRAPGSEAQLAEAFLHGADVVAVVDGDGRPVGLVDQRGFARAVAAAVVGDR